MKLFEIVTEMETQGSCGSDLVPMIESIKHYYTECHRFYHDWRHILDGVSLSAFMARNYEEFNLSLAQQLGWLFHDIVYVPGASHNEENSVKLMYLILGKHDSPFDEDTVDEAATIIRSTITHKPFIESAKAIIDIDLSGFIDPARFDYGSGLLIEEFGVSEEEFYRNQRVFLENNILSKPFIYETDVARAQWEHVARKTLNDAINR